MMEMVMTAGVVQSCSQIVTTNKPTPTFYDWMPFLLPNQLWQSTEEKSWGNH